MPHDVNALAQAFRADGPPRGEAAVDWGDGEPIEQRYVMPITIGREPQPYRPLERYYGDENGDTLANNDDTNVNSWVPKELKNSKENTKTVTISKEVVEAIKDISQEIIDNCLETLKLIYEIRLDSIDNFNYTTLIESMSDSSDSRIYNDFENTVTGYANLLNGEQLNSNGYSRLYLSKLEEIALRRYHIDYSKYRYYPRLKSKIKYGNQELLNNILQITQIGRGIVICQQS